jgi:hypothetical protein
MAVPMVSPMKMLSLDTRDSFVLVQGKGNGGLELRTPYRLRRQVFDNVDRRTEVFIRDAAHVKGGVSQDS